MNNIKVKVKTSVKALDKAKIQTERFKNEIVNIKEKVNNSTIENENNAQDYAVQKFQNSEERLARKGIEQIDKKGMKSVRETKDNFNKVRAKIDTYKNKSISKEADKKINSLIKSKSSIQKSNGAIKNSKNIGRKVDKTIKTADNAKKIAKVTTKETVKLSKKAAQTSVKVIKESAKAIKVTVKAAIQAVKAIATGTKALMSLIIAGGWISVIIILVICLFGGILAIFNSNGDGDTAEYWNGSIVNVAKTQLGVTGGDPYWSWYGFENRVEWCACYVSWCADQCGFIEDGTMPKFSLCSDGVQWFKDKNEWVEGVQAYYYPKAGDIIFFDWELDDIIDHVGIVERSDIDKGKVYTIEGNSKDTCKENEYNWNDSRIYGYGIPGIKIGLTN